MTTSGAAPEPDLALRAVEDELYTLDPIGDRVAGVVRATMDQLYDGQHTGRWDLDQLNSTERKYLGPLVEINLQREFGFADGNATDFRIAGIEVDCKYSMPDGKWSLPPEVVGHLALLITADESRSTWRAGLVRVDELWLNPGRSRDVKATLSAGGRQLVRWLWQTHGRLSENLFLHMTAATRE